MFWRASSWIAVLMLGLVTGIFLHEEKHEFVFKFLLGTGFAFVLNVFLKFFFNVPRAVGLGPAFPSFHTQMAFFIATMASLEEPRLGWALLPLAGFIGFSRIALGFHSLLDVVAGAILGAFVGYWFFKVKLKYISLKEIARQSVHLLGVALVPLAIIFPAKLVGAFCFLVALFAIFAPNTPLKKAANFFRRFKERGYEGAFFFFLASGFTLIVFPFKAALAGIIALSIGDSVATVYGKHIGRVRIFKNKSLEGSMACFIFTFVAVLLVLPLEMALPVAVVGTLIELIPWFNDNLLIPIGVSLTITLMQSI